MATEARAAAADRLEARDRRPRQLRGHRRRVERECAERAPRGGAAAQQRVGPVEAARRVVGQRGEGEDAERARQRRAQREAAGAGGRRPSMAS
jgi:hypothetical protein